MSTPFLGEVVQLGFHWAMQKFALCNGALLPISNNSALFALLGTRFGGNGRTEFGIPDLCGRAPAHPGMELVNQGQKGGYESVTLTSNNIGHRHKLMATSQPGDWIAPVNHLDLSAKYAFSKVGPNTYAGDSEDPAYTAASDLKTIAVGAVSSAGGGQPHPNMQPYTVINFSIALDGTFPPRN